MAKACVKMGKWGISARADIYCLWFMREALPLASGTPVGNKAKSLSPAGSFCETATYVCTHTSQLSQCASLMSAPEWNYSLNSHRQAGSAHYDFCVRRTPTHWHTRVCERGDISHIFLLSRGSAFMEALRPFSFIPFSCRIWKEKGDTTTGKTWPMFGLGLKSWM